MARTNEQRNHVQGNQCKWETLDTIDSLNDQGTYRYILDLINYLKDHDDPVKLEIGLKSAEDLIRQKTGYGTELGMSNGYRHSPWADPLLNVQ